MLGKFFAHERSYFDKLHQDAKNLLVTIFLNNLIQPLFGLFINAFLWRQSHDIILIATYNAVVYAIIPFSFYLNGILLRKFTPAVIFTVSLFIGALAIAVLMFLPKITYPVVISFGLVDGVSAGVYWAVRNLLTLKTTTTHDRIYFSSIESASSTVTNVVIPLVIGWFIALGSIIHIYSPIQGYRLLVLYMLGISLWIGFVSKNITTEISVPVLLVKNISKKWKNFRWFEFILGLKDITVWIIPVMLVLILVGNEAALGTVQSASALLASIIIYTLGKSLTTTHRTKLIAISVTIAFLGAILFGIFYSEIGVLLFFASQALAQPLIWVAGNSINYDLIDIDNKDESQHYAYVCDQELYLNGGRFVGIVLFVLLIYLTSNTFALRFAPILFASTQFMLFFIAKSLEKQQKFA